MARGGFPWFWLFALGVPAGVIVAWFKYPPFKSWICNNIGKNWSICKVSGRMDPFEQSKLFGGVQLSANEEYQFALTDPFSVKKAGLTRAFPIYRNRRFRKLQKSR